MKMGKLWKLTGLAAIIAIMIAGIWGWTSVGKVEAASKQKYAKELNLFNWSEYMPQSVLDKFKQKYGIKVNYATFSSNEEMLAKIQAGGTSQYDLAVASDYMIQIMRKQKQALIEPIDLKSIPNFKNLSSLYVDKDFDRGNKYTVPYLCGTALIVINTQKFKQPVKSYKDLWDPKFKNSLVVLDDERAIIGMALKKLGYSLNETDQKKLMQAKAELVKVLPNIKAYDSDSPKTLLINGEAGAGLIWSGEASLALRENPHLAVVYPQEGMYLWQDNFFIPKGSSHKKEAELFINFVLDPENAAMISKAFPYTTPNTAALKFLGKVYLDDKAANPPKSELTKGEYLKDVGAATRVYDRIWSEIKQK
jgi:spermidine/putrescine transport system permease protein